MLSEEMTNPFSRDFKRDISDEKLVTLSLAGDRNALETLIKRHQAWIFNIAIRMTGNLHDAEDASQEVLIKVITKLSSFKGKSSFRTWLFRIVKNHVLNMKKKEREKIYSSFGGYKKAIENSPDLDLLKSDCLPADVSMIIEETKIHCVMGMLLCLNREQRLVFILGEILGADSAFGSEILEITRVNFRKRLSRARKSVFGFMKDVCGIVDGNNACRCSLKSKVLINKGAIDPRNLEFNSNYIYLIKNVAEKRLRRFNDVFENKCRILLENDPFKTPPDYVDMLRSMIENKDLEDIFDFKSMN